MRPHSGTRIACRRSVLQRGTRCESRIIPGIIDGHHRTSGLRGQEQGLRPAPVGGPAADDPRARRHPADQPAADGARGRPRHGVRHHERRAAQDVRGDTSSATSASRCRTSPASASTRSSSSAAPPRRSGPFPSKVLSLEELNAPKVFAEMTNRPRGLILCTGPDRLGQVDDAGGDGQPRQRERVRPHPHDRGPDRVPARVEEVPDQPARARAAHAVVPERAAQPRCARTRTTSWSAKCATSRRSGSR